jgi:glycosyltransferase involved in cell wall biosynthesis
LNDLLTFAKERNDSNVLILPPVSYDFMPRVIAACDIGLVLLPDHERWRFQCPIKLVEFMFMGKPVLASDLPGIKWVAGDSPQVEFLGGWRPEDFKAKIETLISRDNIETATKEYAERFSSRKLAIDLRNLIEE